MGSVAAPPHFVAAPQWTPLGPAVLAGRRRPFPAIHLVEWRYSETYARAPGPTNFAIGNHKILIVNKAFRPGRFAVVLIREAIGF